MGIKAKFEVLSEFQSLIFEAMAIKRKLIKLSKKYDKTHDKRYKEEAERLTKKLLSKFLTIEEKMEKSGFPLSTEEKANFELLRSNLQILLQKIESESDIKTDSELLEKYGG
mgnify:CR=1 FL=1